MIHLRKEPLLSQEKRKNSWWKHKLKLLLSISLIILVNLPLFSFNLLLPPPNLNKKEIISSLFNTGSISIANFKLRPPLSIFKPILLQKGKIRYKNNLLILDNVTSYFQFDQSITLRGLTTPDLKEINLILKLKKIPLSKILYFSPTLKIFNSQIISAEIQIKGSKQELTFSGNLNISSTLIKGDFKLISSFFLIQKKLKVNITGINQLDQKNIFFQGIYLDNVGWISVSTNLKQNNTDIEPISDYNKEENIFQDKSILKSDFSLKSEQQTTNSPPDIIKLDFDSYKKNILENIQRDIHKIDFLLEMVEKNK